MADAWNELPAAGRTLVRFLALAVGYWLAAQAGLMLTIPGSSVAPVWPSQGIAVSAVVIWGWRYAPAVWLGQFAVSLTHGEPLLAAAVIAVGSMAETLVAYQLLCRPTDQVDFCRVAGVLDFIGKAVLLAPISSAMVGPAALAWTGIIEWAHLPPAAATWWLGDAMGVLVIAPVALTWGLPHVNQRAHALELIPVLIATLLLALVASGLILHPLDISWVGPPLGFMVFPPLIWAALRTGPKGTSLALAIVATAGLGGAATGHGLFVIGPLTQRVVLIDLFLSATAVTMLLLAAAVCRYHRVIAEVELARMAAEGANAEKSHFIAAVRHDLAHPLQAAELFLGTLQRRALPDSARPLVERTIGSLRSMAETLASLQDITTLDAGGAPRPPSPVPMARVLDHLAEETLIQAEAKGLRFRYHRCSVMVLTDPALLSRIVRNLLSNALRYTDQGRIVLGCRRVTNGVRIEVWDTGVGITPEIREAIFEPFRRGSERGGGVGLGLSIVRRLSQHLDLKVGVSSVPGKGSCFWVQVPKA